MVSGGGPRAEANREARDSDLMIRASRKTAKLGAGSRDLARAAGLEIVRHRGDSL